MKASFREIAAMIVFLVLNLAAFLALGFAGPVPRLIACLYLGTALTYAGLISLGGLVARSIVDDAKSE